MDEPILDCLIIGGGPAGLTAAIYLARFHLDIMVVDGGKSRASWIPCTRNVSGFPDGIEGTELLQRMREQACKYGAKIETEFVTKLERDESGLFTATWGSGSATARTVLLATGVTNRRPPMDEELHERALARGLGGLRTRRDVNARRAKRAAQELTQLHDLGFVHGVSEGSGAGRGLARRDAPLQDARLAAIRFFTPAWAKTFARRRELSRIAEKWTPVFG